MASGGRTPAQDLEHALVLETVRVTEAAALAASYWSGKGDKHEVDRAATEAIGRP